VFEGVVLVVYGWKSVEPGTLSWVFPSLTAAVCAAHAMTNAVEWAIVTSSSVCAKMDCVTDLATLRAIGGVLLEQTA